MQLSLTSLPLSLATKPGYDPEELHIGVVHFGPGAFHRAHQAVYFDALATADKRWGICGVSLHSTGVRDALTPQDGLYTLAILDSNISYQVIGSIREVLVGPEDTEAVFERLTRPSVSIVTSTVTEKGYCLGQDFSLDLNHSDITQDIINPKAPKSFIGYIVEGLRRRKIAGLAPFVLIPCDNLPNNGQRLKAAVVAFAVEVDGELADWIERLLVAPCTMVDSITPATDDALRARVTKATGLEDAWPIQREAFTQWVIEEHVHDGGPDWQSVGIILTDNVPAYERAKLRLLNGPHSTLAYAGLHKGYESVSEAVSDDNLANFIRSLMLEDIKPLLEAPKGLDLTAYSEDILARFHNPAITHKLSQIAWDGSQKLPIRILSSMSEALERDQNISRFALPLAAWMRFVRAKAVTGETLTDPLATDLIAIGQLCRDNVSDVSLFLELKSIFPPRLTNSLQVISAINESYIRLLEAEKSHA